LINCHLTSQHAWSLGGTAMSKRSRNKNWSAMYGHMAPMAYLTSGWLWLRTIGPGSSNGSVTRRWEPRWQRHTLTCKLTRRGFLILSIKIGHRAFRDHPGRLHYSGSIVVLCAATVGGDECQNKFTSKPLLSILPVDNQLWVHDRLVNF
jgi:hypothetical protein